MLVYACCFWTLPFRDYIVWVISKGENRSTQRKACCSAILFTHTNPTYTDPISSQELHIERPVTKQPSCGTARKMIVTVTPAF